MFEMMKNASVERLIEISKQDPAWCENGHVINAFGYLGEYAIQYEAGYFYLERVEL